MSAYAKTFFTDNEEGSTDRRESRVSCRMRAYEDQKERSRVVWYWARTEVARSAISDDIGVDIFRGYQSANHWEERVREPPEAMTTGGKPRRPSISICDGVFC